MTDGVIRCRWCTAVVYPRPATATAPAIVDVHPCCRYWCEERGLDRCPSCAVSIARRDEARRRRDRARLR